METVHQQCVTLFESLLLHLRYAMHILIFILQLTIRTAFIFTIPTQQEQEYNISGVLEMELHPHRMNLGICIPVPEITMFA